MVIKKLLREELYIINEKQKLSESSLRLIKDDSYVKSVLGIDILLYENNNRTYNKLIIERQLIIEDLLKSIESFVGKTVQKAKQVYLTFIDTIKDTKDLAIFFKNLILEPSLMEEAIKKVDDRINDKLKFIKDGVNKILTKVKTVINNFDFQEVFTNILNKVNDFFSKINKNVGWFSFISKLFFAVALTWISDKILTKIFDLTVDKLIEQIKNIKGIETMLNNLSTNLQSLISNDNIKFIIEKLIGFGTGIEFVGYAFVATDIIKIVHDILIPVVITLKKKFNLAKS